ncbi:MAG TPA: aspartate carbamoyltransferase catalytic subunit [Aliiroseovarius sp.]|nr:aspartate carbamoyltransferase catalytic subunit [Aliiroseovarius sp.]
MIEHHETSGKGWHGILDNGERILWQGRPDTGFHASGGELRQAVFGLFFAGFAVFWMTKAALGPGGFWAFGLIHFSVGIWFAANGLFGSTWRRRHTFYSLSNQRAFIASDFQFTGRKLRSYTITPKTRLDYMANGDLETIHFATERRKGSKGRSYEVKIGFERVEDGEKAYRLMREVQAGKHG